MWVICSTTQTTALMTVHIPTRWPPFFTLMRPHPTSPSVFWDGCRQKTWSPWVSLHESAVFFLFPHWVQEDTQQWYSPHTVLYCTGAIQSFITPWPSLPPAERVECLKVFFLSGNRQNSKSWPIVWMKCLLQVYESVKAPAVKNQGREQFCT